MAELLAQPEHGPDTPAVLIATSEKCIGTNHVLSTRKAGNYTGGLRAGKFLKTQTYQEIVDEKASGEMGRLYGRCSRAENFEGHVRSGDLRAQKYLGDEHGCINQAMEEF
ncbi:hypothetical protein CEP53_005822 [Fusarium sp. AF-6]|nr:hypothetical protein CEP53_005822 [Fusarium sp. AF-6]